MFEFFAIAIAVVALIIARKAQDQAAGLRARLDALEATEWRLPQAPPPLVPSEPQSLAAAGEPSAAPAGTEQGPPIHEAPPSAPDDSVTDVPRTTAVAPPPFPPPPPASRSVSARAGWCGWAD